MTRFTRLHTVLGLAMGIAGLVSTGFSQRQGNTPAPTAPGTPGAGSTTPGRGIPGNTNPNTFPNPNDPNNPNNQNNRFPDQQRPIFISGKVMLDDGNPPGDSVVIERVCNGNPRAEGYTDSKGRFSFQLGQNQGVMQDASMGSAGVGGIGGYGTQGGTFGNDRTGGGFGGASRGGGFSERDLMGCEIRAALPGF